MDFITEQIDDFMLQTLADAELELGIGDGGFRTLRTNIYAKDLMIHLPDHKMLKVETNAEIPFSIATAADHFDAEAYAYEIVDVYGKDGITMDDALDMADIFDERLNTVSDIFAEHYMFFRNWAALDLNCSVLYWLHHAKPGIAYPKTMDNELRFQDLASMSEKRLTEIFEGCDPELVRAVQRSLVSRLRRATRIAMSWPGYPM